MTKWSLLLQDSTVFHFDCANRLKNLYICPAHYIFLLLHFSSNKVERFLFPCVPFLPVLPCSVKKVNKLLCNILVTSSPKTTKNQVTKMGWKAHLSKIIPFHICQQHVSTKSANDFCEKYMWDFFRFSHDNWRTTHQISAADRFEMVSKDTKI